MRTLFPEPKTAAEAALQSRIIRRAEVLFTEGGYDYEPFRDFPGWFAVSGSEGQLHMVNATCSCDCEAFSRFGDCKHRIALEQEMDREDAMCAEYDALEKLYAGRE